MSILTSFVELNIWWRMLPHFRQSVEKRRRYTQINMKKKPHSWLIDGSKPRGKCLRYYFFSLHPNSEGYCFHGNKGWVCVFLLDLLQFMMLTSGEICPRCREWQNIRLLFSICAPHESARGCKKKIKVCSISGTEIKKYAGCVSQLLTICCFEFSPMS